MAAYDRRAQPFIIVAALAPFVIAMIVVVVLAILLLGGQVAIEPAHPHAEPPGARETVLGQRIPAQRVPGAFGGTRDDDLAGDVQRGSLAARGGDPLVGEVGAPDVEVATQGFLGMQQKIAIIGGLIHAPSVLFMDEPTVGLDPRSARLIKDILIQERDEGNSVLFSTHILEIAENMCDRVIIINQGRIIADAPVNELTKLPGRDQSLEQVFLALTGGSDVDDMVKELSDV